MWGAVGVGVGSDGERRMKRIQRNGLKRGWMTEDWGSLVQGEEEMERYSIS